MFFSLDIQLKPHHLGIRMATVRSHLKTAGTRWLPRGWGDALRQVLLFVGAYLGYQVVRGVIDGNDVAKASWNATKVIHLERALHVFIEPSVQAWANVHWVMDIADWTYFNSHYVMTSACCCHLRPPQRLLLLRAQHVHDRDADRARRLRPVSDRPAAADARVGLHRRDPAVHRRDRREGRRAPRCSTSTPAIPSMHVCFALMIGLPMARLSKRRPARSPGASTRCSSRSW